MLARINHITFLTRDLDRLVSFYDDVFRAQKLVELPVPEPEGPGRHALILVGGGATLHVFELSRMQPPPPRTVTDFGVMRVLTFVDPDGHSVELAHWVGDTDPAGLDAALATDEEIIARRLQRPAGTS